MKLTRMTEGLLRLVDEDGTISLGIELGLYADRTTLTTLTKVATSEWYIARDEQITSWKPTGIINYEDRLLLCGPYLEGVTLDEVLRRTPPSVLPYVSRFARLIDTLQQNKAITPTVYTRTILFLSDGGMLIPPTEFCTELLRFVPDNARRLYWEPFHHPDLNPEMDLQFAIAIMAYRACVPELPFKENDHPAQLREYMRNGVVADVRMIDAGIKAEVAQTIDTALSNPRNSKYTLHHWSNIFHEWLQQGTHVNADAVQSTETHKQMRELFRRRERSYTRRTYIRLNGRRIVMVALLVVALGSVPFTIIRGVLQPSAVAGLSPPEVVRLYYNSQNLLDHETMQDCVAGKTGADDIGEVTNLFVISRVRQAFEQRQPLIDPLVWRNRGSVDIGEAALFGIEDLTISIQSEGIDRAEISVEYIKWYPGTGDEQAVIIGPGNSVAFARRDQLYLQRNDDEWQIYEIIRHRNEPLTERP